MFVIVLQQQGTRIQQRGCPPLNHKRAPRDCPKIQLGFKSVQSQAKIVVIKEIKGNPFRILLFLNVKVDMDIKELKITDHEAVSRHPWEQARLEVVLDLISKFAGEGLKKETPVLDIGCGDLFVAEELASHFPKTPFYAIDTAFDPELIDSLKAKLSVNNVDVFPSLDDAATLCHQPASAVLLLDVIEHIEDDVSFLKSLRQHPLINSETRIFITVPAFQGLYSGHDEFLGHFRRYNSRQLRETLKRAGFDIVTDGYFFSSLLLPRLLEVLIEKLIKDNLKQAKGVSNWNGAKVKDAVITSVLVSDFKIGQAFKKLNINFPGLSAYAVCKKSP